MTDLQILLITIAAAGLLWAYLELCDRVRG
jgi:hypothetical protein